MVGGRVVNAGICLLLLYQFRWFDMLPDPVLDTMPFIYVRGLHLSSLFRLNMQQPIYTMLMLMQSQAVLLIN